jgi:TetR/AcrR family transcriptional regulator, transcriptional repressor for nem operon
VPGRTRQQRLTKFQLLFPSMAGVLTSVRMNVSPEKREELLTEARSFFIRLFAQE